MTVLTAGVSLVEVLVALGIIALIVFIFRR